jgi:hypothetical protein
VTEKYFHGVPEELVKDYRLELYSDEKSVWAEEVSGNYLRHRIHAIDSAAAFNTVRLSAFSTWGLDCIRLFEIRVYRNRR